MKVRIIAGLTMLPLLTLIYLGGWFLSISVLFLCIFALYEYNHSFKSIEMKPSWVIGILSTLGLLYIQIFLTDGVTYKFSYSFNVWLFLTALLCMLYMFKIKERTLYDGMITLFGIIYISYFASHLILLDQLGGFKYTFLVIFSAFGSDVFAYFVGSAMGKHKLCPNISPKKSIEGAIGGLLGSVIIVSAFVYIFMPDFLIHGIIIGVIGSIAGQIGDLTASIIKRKIGIKDYGKLIPGHGGLLDRFDSIIFVTPVVFYYIIFFVEKSV